ncbi:hypothetical protein KM043_001109 [Ampulex compressa]|nr:hypothetical protein KM043_001109 [Ampulex compressa]
MSQARSRFSLQEIAAENSSPDVTQVNDEAPKPGTASSPHQQTPHQQTPHQIPHVSSHPHQRHHGGGTEEVTQEGGKRKRGSPSVVHLDYWLQLISQEGVSPGPIEARVEGKKVSRRVSAGGDPLLQPGITGPSLISSAS